MSKDQEKSAQNFLHLYIGCDCQLLYRDGMAEKADEFAPTLTHYVQDNFDKAKVVKMDAHTVAFFSPDFIKPILRPLSDMTEEEFKDVAHLKYTLPEDEIQQIVKERRIDLLETSSTVFVYLLSKHFDLFRLIEAGLAIDKTKMNTHE
jgi:thiol-disulfide isomerase/thioredoxin